MKAKRDKHHPSRTGSPQEDILEALHDVMSNELDRSILLSAREAQEELSWSELHRRVGVPSRQPYQDALDRLHGHILIKRRLRPAGRQHRTFISPSPRGIQFADLLIGIAKQGKIPDSTPAGLREAIQEEILGVHRFAAA